MSQIHLIYDEDQGILSADAGRAKVVYMEPSRMLMVLHSTTGEVLHEQEGYVFGLPHFIGDVNYYKKICNP